jgi:uncharacterized protein
LHIVYCSFKTGTFFYIYNIKYYFMRWQGRRESTNVEDRRGVSGGQVAVGGGIIGVIALVLNFLLGGDVSQLPQQLPNQNTPVSAEEQAADDQRAKFVKVVLAETEDVWNTLFQQAGKNYVEPTLTLFSGATQSR